MKIYLDDCRPLPIWAKEDNWILVKTYEEIIKLLETGEVIEISLDHDLGGVEIGEKTGYDVLIWIERKVVEERFVPPRIEIHTANLGARLSMEQAVRSIKTEVEVSKMLDLP